MATAGRAGSNVRAPAPAPVMFEAVLEGWSRQQRSRLLARKTVRDRLRLVGRFAEYAGTYPRQGTPEVVEAYFAAQFTKDPPAAHSTVRGRQNDLELFCSFITDSRYGRSAATRGEQPR
ncbi:hypothetical protein A4E84_00780 [Streptomyces qaidamensis]|uniref:Core-binding (CB) domain-containing protein n=1 Tax=Streptomyces qaidamensis TaxID=1783515 RepID=A0A143BSG9_9ACTN|nr:hypothetical protein [Streptomyces qaidamensis]AMW08198.1 hypothetical protein A4E84_00780 [Streptomyces qaidamensis]